MTRILNTRKVFVGLSGGVDSAVSAALLKSQGFEVTGVFIKVWQPFDEAQGKPIVPCTWRDERRDAMRVAIALDIPFLFFDFEEEYKREVVDKMIAEYQVGRTPNPDVLCNKEIKFGAFWKKARDLGADFIATGHYARIENNRNEVLSSSHGQRGKFATDSTSLRLIESRDKEKDQSYFLWTLTEDDLSHTLFPVGGLEKSEVRQLARQYRLPVSEKKDSQGICFVGEVSMNEFLSHFVSTEPGDVVNTGGEIIGTHSGAVFYTIGARHGFEILKKKAADGAFYVVSKDIKTNTIVVSSKEPEIISLSPARVKVKNINWISEPVGSSLAARIRYRGEKLPVTLFPHGLELEAEFKRPVRGLAFGQSIVFYDGEICLGGGVMDEVST